MNITLSPGDVVEYVDAGSGAIYKFKVINVYSGDPNTGIKYELEYVSSQPTGGR